VKHLFNIPAFGIFKRNMKKMLPLVFLLISMKPVADEGNEYSIKAMFIYNFARNIDWSSSSNSGVFRIGVVGKSEIFDALQLIAMQKKIDNRQIEVRKTEIDDQTTYQVIFIPKSQSQRLEELARKYAGKGVLIVSEECKRSERGATINLITSDNKVRFELNQSSARNAGLKVSNTLINLAVVVNP
jgi:hypothetical protein